VLQVVISEGTISCEFGHVYGFLTQIKADSTAHIARNLVLALREEFLYQLHTCLSNLSVIEIFLLICTSIFEMKRF